MGKGSPKVPVFAYKMSIQWGMCHGPLDFLHSLIVREKTIWSGRKCGPDALFINEPTIFGGHLEEGGVQGFAYLQIGSESQFLHPHVAEKYGDVPENLPGYRGIATLTFTEADNTRGVEGATSSGGKGNPGFDGKGFYWVSQQPYLPGVWAEIQRIPKPFLQDKAYIFREAGYGSPAVGQNYCFAITWDEEIGLLNDQPSEDGWVRDIQDFDGDGVDDSRADAIYTLVAKFCEELVALGEGSSEITLHFFKGAAGFNDDDLELLGSPARPTSWNNPAFDDNDNFAKVGPFVASAVDTVGGYGGIDLPRGTNAGSHADNSSGFAGASGLFDKVLEDHDAGGSFDYVFFVSEHAEDDRWDQFSSGLPWKYSGQGLAGNNEMKADYRRIAHDFRARCIKFRMLAYYDFHLVAGVLDANEPGTTYWDVLYMISGGESEAYDDPSVISASGWYGPFVDTLNSSFAWHWWYSRFHGFSAQSFLDTGAYDTSLSNIYSDPDTAAFYEANQGFPDGFDVGGGGEAWIEYFFSTRIFADRHDANPAHMIVECLTNQDWGMGYPFAALDMASFSAAACTLYDETFGLSMMWVNQETIEKFVSEIIDHIDAALYIDPETGLFRITLIRDDYNENDLPRYGPDRLNITKFSVRSPAEAVNEITVSWTNPENEQEETITIQDQGAIIANDGIIKSETRSYYGIRRRDLATTVCARDIRSAAAPITTIEAKTDRRAWKTKPGGLVKVFYPEYGVDESDPLIMRLMVIDYGKPGAREITVSLVEDIFSLAPHSFATPPGTNLTDESTPPSEADSAQVLTLPYFFAFNLIGVGAGLTSEYPDVFMGVLVEESDDGSDTFNLFGDTVNPAGVSSQENLGSRSVTAKGTLQAALAWEAESTILDWGTLSNGAAPAVGGFVLIGDPGDTEADRELALISAEAGGSWTIKRGVLDTVPRAWAAGTEVWILSIDSSIEDQTVRAEAQMLDYVVQIVATGGVLPPSTITPVATYTATARPHLPHRPADVAIDGKQFQDVFYTSTPTTVDVTWAERNRLDENAVVLGWDETTVTPEVGTTYEIEIYDEGDVLLNTLTGITGTGHNIPEAEFSNTGVGYIRVYSKRDGLRSLQYYEARVDTRANSGYGFDYGNNYGG